MILLIKQACKFLVALCLLLGVFAEVYAILPTPVTATDGTVGSAYNFNLQTMPGAAVENGPLPAPPGSIFTQVVTVPAGALPNGLVFNGSELITGVPTLAGTYRNTYKIILGTGLGTEYFVTFNIFAAAVPSSGGGGDSAPVCNCINLEYGSTIINGGVVTMGNQVYPGSLTVGSLGAVLRSPCVRLHVV